MIESFSTGRPRLFGLIMPALIAIVLLYPSPAWAQEDMCSAGRTSSMGVFFAFVVNCDCSAADRSIASGFFQSYASNLCGTEFAEEVDIYYEYALERGWMVDGRCLGVCGSNTGIMMTSMLSILSGVEGEPGVLRSTEEWDVESGALGELSGVVIKDIDRAVAADRQEGLAGAELSETPEQSSDSLSKWESSDDRDAELFCRTQPSSRKCQRTYSD